MPTKPTPRNPTTYRLDAADRALLARLADAERCSQAEIFRRALRLYARQAGVPETQGEDARSQGDGRGVDAT